MGEPNFFSFTGGIPLANGRIFNSGFGYGLYKGVKQFLWLFKNGRFTPPAEQTTNYDINYRDYYGEKVAYGLNKMFVVNRNFKVVTKSLNKNSGSIKYSIPNFDENGDYPSFDSDIVGNEAYVYQLNGSTLNLNEEFADNIINTFTLSEADEFYQALRNVRYDVFVKILPIGNDTVLIGVRTGSYSGNIYKSIDNGETWGCVEYTNKIKDLCHCGNGVCFYVETSSSNPDLHFLYRSTDYGETWSIVSGVFPEQIITGINGEIVGIERLSANSFKIYRSIDYGETWSSYIKDTLCTGKYVYLRGIFADGVCVFFDFEAYHYISHLYVSSDYGQTWIVFTNTGLEVTLSPDSLYYYGNGIFVSGGFRSVDYGQTWIGGCASVGYISKVDGHEVWLGSSGMGIYRSVDYGTTWNRVFTATSGGGQFRDFIGLENGLCVCRDGFNSVIYKSVDYGQTWVRSPIEISATLYLLTYVGKGFFMFPSYFYGSFFRNRMPQFDINSIVCDTACYNKSSDNFVIKTSVENYDISKDEDGNFLLYGTKYSTPTVIEPFPEVGYDMSEWEHIGLLISLYRKYYLTEEITFELIVQNCLFDGDYIGIEDKLSVKFKGIEINETHFKNIFLYFVDMSGYYNLITRLKRMIKITADNHVVICNMAEDENLWIDGNTYTIENVEGYAVVDNYVCMYNFSDDIKYKIFDCTSHEIHLITIEGSGSVVAPYVLSDEEFIYFVYPEANYGAVSVKKSDFSYKFITQENASAYSITGTIGGYKGKIVAKEGIITLSDDGNGSFKAFTEAPDSDVLVQYGGEYFN